MCGIVCLFGEKKSIPKNLLTHRGPDDFRSETLGKCQIDYYRLAINDLSPAAMQPFKKYNSLFACNGEIYNYRDFLNGDETSLSDCEPVHKWMKTFGPHATMTHVRGDYAFVYTDGEHVIAGRDRAGVRPLFYSKYAPDSIAFASEAKALRWLGTKIEVFPPGAFYDSRIDGFVSVFKNYWKVMKLHSSFVNVKKYLEDAVRVRLALSDRATGFLLSGGLDSSLVCAVAQKIRFPQQIQTFSIGLEGSPDLEAARKVADHIGSLHTEVHFTVEEGLAVVPSVIEAIESYDCTTVRASVPMYLLCKWIKENTDCRYIFSGEGSDELLGGYLYFKNAPSVDAFSMENVRRLRLIHQFDGLRADRCCAAHGLDLTVPFLDNEFIEKVMNIDQKLKMTKVEKEVLRKSFEGYLPEEILWRQKDAFSDAVGSEWVDALRTIGDTMGDEHFKNIQTICRGKNVPLTKEEARYRELFWFKFCSKNDHLISEIWRPKWTTVTDPSARLLIDNKQ
jgi:asparagine synthase (glutamine-hydrolysing)